MQLECSVIDTFPADSWFKSHWVNSHFHLRLHCSLLIQLKRIFNTLCWIYLLLGGVLWPVFLPLMSYLREDLESIRTDGHSSLKTQWSHGDFNAVFNETPSVMYTENKVKISKTLEFGRSPVTKMCSRRHQMKLETSPRVSNQAEEPQE